MIFENRIAAARQLAEALSDYAGKHPLVLAVPRGAVPMATVDPAGRVVIIVNETAWLPAKP